MGAIFDTAIAMSSKDSKADYIVDVDVLLITNRTEDVCLYHNDMFRWKFFASKHVMGIQYVAVEISG